MKLSYFNTELTDAHARVTFIGRDVRGKTRRPLVELDASDLAGLVRTARNFRDHQLAIAKKHTARADTITTALENT